MNKPVYILLFITLFAQFVTAQTNLVRNGSFEEYWQCPFENDLNNGELEKAKYWWKPTFGTSDYFNSCNGDIVDVPTNFWGYQQASEGSGYVGLGPSDFYKISGDILGSEYIMTKLSKPLKPCTSYRLSFDVSLADFSHYSFSYIGAKLVTDSFYVASQDLLPRSGTVAINTEPLNDTINWTRLSFDIDASGGEQFLCIGYFPIHPLSDTLFFQSSSVFPGIGYGYYYIDNVILSENSASKECSLYLPNIITANGDGINDEFDITLFSGLEPTLSIVDRWGKTVARLSSTNPVWRPSNEEHSDGIYFYNMYYVINGSTFYKTGFIHLVR